METAAQRPAEPANCVPAVDKTKLPQALVVDDDPLSQQFCCHVLRSAGLMVHQAYSGQQALQRAQVLIRAAARVVVLMDGQLPDISGPEALRRWPRQPLSTVVPPMWIGMTADDGSAARESFLRAGCRHVLIKPFASQDLLDLLGPQAGMAAREALADDAAPRTAPHSDVLRQKFAASLRSDLQALDQALYGQQWCEFRRILHCLSGAAAISGHKRLTALCRRLLAGTDQSLMAECASEFSSAYIQLRQQAAELRRQADNNQPG